MERVKAAGKHTVLCDRIKLPQLSAVNAIASNYSADEMYVRFFFCQLKHEELKSLLNAERNIFLIYFLYIYIKGNFFPSTKLLQTTQAASHC